jgi:hypothetical protein
MTVTRSNGVNKPTQGTTFMFVDTFGFGVRLSPITFIVFDAIGLHVSWRGREWAWTRGEGWTFG